jgi:outer membrane lipoprotein carrier protein
MLLSGSPEKLAQAFLITKQTNTFTLIPKNKTGLFQSVQLTFDDEHLTHMKLVDNLGQITNIQFSQVQNNPSLNSKLFQFKVPAGVDVVRQ